MTQSQQLRKSWRARSATAFLLAALCVFPLYIDKFSNLGVVKFTGICTLSWAFALWLGALACVGARPDPGRLLVEKPTPHFGRWARSQRRAWCPPCSPSRRGPRSGGLAATTAAV